MALSEGVRWLWRGAGRLFPALFFQLLLAFFLVSAGRTPGDGSLSSNHESEGAGFLSTAADFLWQSRRSGYRHVWPEMEFGWRMVAGTIVGFLGAALGSVGGVGGGGIFVPMLSLIIGFDPKSATAISKCMIMGAALSTVYYNLKLRHPTLNMPIIDYDLAVLIQPMLMLGISVGVAFNVIFPDWLVTVLLIILFVGTSSKSFMKGVETWQKESESKKEAAKRGDTESVGKCLVMNAELLTTNLSVPFVWLWLFTWGFGFADGNAAADYQPLPSEPGKHPQERKTDKNVGILENIYWTELGLLVFVWVAFLALQLAKNHTATCSTAYWVVNLLQIPVSVSVSFYEAMNLYKGRRSISSKGDEGTNFKVYQLVMYCGFGLLAGIVGGLLGLGGGFIMGPLFLELGLPPQVSSATATFAMIFSSSMSVIEYYLLKRFPVPYALYFIAVATVAALVGQQIIRRLIIMLGRASLIIFVLASTIFISAITLGGVGIANMIGKIQRHDYMGFEDLCKYDG